MTTTYKPGDALTLEHANGSKLIVEVCPRTDYVSIPSLFASGKQLTDYTLNGWSVTSHVPAVTLPTDPFAAYVDKYGHDVWFTDGAGKFRCITNGSSDPRKYAPFTRLAPVVETAQEVIDHAETNVRVIVDDWDMGYEAGRRSVAEWARKHFGIEVPQ